MPDVPVIGYQVYVAEGGEEIGAVRDVRPDGRDVLVVYIENAGELELPLAAVTRVHDQKVVIDTGQLKPWMRDAIAHAHDAEVPGW
jgi:hypothetical protein